MTKLNHFLSAVQGWQIGEQFILWKRGSNKKWMEPQLVTAASSPRDSRAGSHHLKGQQRQGSLPLEIYFALQVIPAAPIPLKLIDLAVKFFPV